MKLLAGVALGALVGGAVAARFIFRGPGNDVLLPPGTPPDWRERAKRNAV
jgi:hypothetical protein